MKPGETLKIRLINDLPPNRDILPSNPSHPHQFNNTNLHFHGAHCSPSGIADNVMRSMAPRQVVRHRHRAARGPHARHLLVPSASPRLGRCAGGERHGGCRHRRRRLADVPEIARARERVMLLTQVVFDAFCMIEDFGTLFPETSTRFLAINGQRRPTIDMRPGEVQRWRLVGSQYQDNMLLELDRHRLNVIAYDGIQLGTLQEMKQLLISPGQRADVLVHAGGPGTYELNAMPFDQGHPSPTGPLARVVVRRRAAADDAPGRTAQAAARDDPRQRDHRPAHADPGGHLAGERCRRPLAGIHLHRGRQDLRSLAHRPAGASGHGGGMDDPQHPRARRPYVPHPHQPVPGHRGQPQADRPWRDTAVVPRPAKAGSVVIRSRLLDYTGVFMLHCHMMNHEEMGMMQTVEVYKD